MKRWWYPLTQAHSGEPISTKTGADLKVLEPQDVKSGAVIEVTKATDAEEGPAEPDSTAERTFVLSKKGEYYLESVRLGAPADEVATVLKAAETEVKAAVATTCQQVDRATHDVEQAMLSLATALPAVEAEKARAAAVQVTTQAAVEEARQSVVGAPNDFVPTGCRLVDSEIGEAYKKFESPEAPATTMAGVVVWDPEQEVSDNNPPEEPELLTNYPPDLERPSTCEESCFTLLGGQAWKQAEAVAASASEAELKTIRINACAREWQAPVAAATPVLPTALLEAGLLKALA